MLCPDCGADIPADDVNLDNLVAKCRQCNNVFSFAGQVQAHPAKEAPAKRVPRPDGLRVEDDADRRRIVRVWFTCAVVFLIFFCIAWDSFLVFWYTMAFTAGPGGGFQVIVVVFPIAHLAIGIGLTYATLAMLVNRTVVEVTGDRLRVRHGPVPWPGNRDLDVTEVRQLFVKEKQSQGRYGTQYYRYDLNAALADDRTVALLSNLDDRMTALFYKQQLEDWLRIKPEHVPGAVE